MKTMELLQHTYVYAKRHGWQGADKRECAQNGSILGPNFAQPSHTKAWMSDDSCWFDRSNEFDSRLQTYACVLSRLVFPFWRKGAKAWSDVQCIYLPTHGIMYVSNTTFWRCMNNTSIASFGPQTTTHCIYGRRRKLPWKLCSEVEHSRIHSLSFANHVIYV